MSTPNIPIPLAEVKKHRLATNAWIVIHNEVYDVTKFLNNHPGGRDPLLSVAGKDGTQAFEDVGHSDDARNMLKKYRIGQLRPEDRIIYIEPCCGAVPSKKASGRSSSSSKRDRTHKERVQGPVECIIVPRENRWWLWVLLLAGVAAGGAFAYKKYSGP